MAVSLDRVLVPVGEIDPSIYWPGLSEAEYSPILEEYLSDARRRGTAGALVNTPPLHSLDDFVRYWTYYRAAKAKYDALIGRPASISDAEDGSSSYTQGQLDAWATKVADYLALAEGLLVSAAVTGGYGPITERTRSVPLCFEP